MCELSMCVRHARRHIAMALDIVLVICYRIRKYVHRLSEYRTFTLVGMVYVAPQAFLRPAQHVYAYIDAPFLLWFIKTERWANWRDSILTKIQCEKTTRMSKETTKHGRWLTANFLFATKQNVSCGQHPYLSFLCSFTSCFALGFFFSFFCWDGIG